MELSVENLSCARGGVPVLAGVNLTLAPGRALILQGPNGSGKTTLLRCIAGLQPPLSGQISGAADRIAYASHADAIKTSLSVAENLEFWAGIYGTGAIESALKAMQIESLGDRLAQNLSAGQKRRLGLARLLVTGRPVWLLDEPTVSLDAASIQLFVAMIGTHLSNGGSALIATHVDLGFTAEILDITPLRAARNAHTDAFDEAFL